MNERVKIEGFVTISQKDENGREEILAERKENHFVDTGLRGLLSYLLGNDYYNQNAWCKSTPGNLYWRSYLGLDTVTPTTHNLTALVNPIGTAPGTAPGTIAGEDRSSPATGVWKMGLISIWSPGTVSGTVGELALYMAPFNSITAGWTDHDNTISMISRLSVADGDFAGVVIDTSKSFVVHWEIQISFS
jgi:hypothetical protein